MMKAIKDRYRSEARGGRLVFQQCRSCGHKQAFPRAFCRSCGSDGLDWLSAAGPGKIAAVSTLHRAPTPEYREKVPYLIALVDLEEGVRVMGHAAPGLAVGDSVRIGFAVHGDQHLLYFSDSRES
jgi:uncharacterized protein